MTISALWMLGLTALILAFLFMSRRRHELVGLHLAMFTLEMLAYGALWVEYSQHDELDGTVLALVLALLCVYIGCTLWFGRRLRHYSGGVLLASLAVRDWEVAVGLGLWLTVKTLLYAWYGNDVLAALDERVSGGVPRALVDLDRFLFCIAWGAYYSCVIRIRPRDMFSLRGILLILFLIGNLFLENSGAGKRLLISTGVLIAYFRAGTDTLTVRKAIAWGLLVCGIVAGSSYYEKVRSNFAELVRASPSRGAVRWTEFIEAFIPRSEHDLAADLRTRDAPIELLYSLSMRQIEEDRAAGGKVATQVLANLVPGGIGDKQFEDDDTEIGEAFNFSEDDLATTVVAVIQSEIWVAAYVLTPALYVFLFWLYCYFLSSRDQTARRPLLASLESMALLGGAFTTALSIESGLTDVLGRFRDVAGILVAAWIVRVYWTRKRRRLQSASVGALEQSGFQSAT